MINSATIGESIERAIRYVRLIHDCMPVDMEIQGDRAFVFHRNPFDLPFSRHAAEMMIGFWIARSRFFMANSGSPLEVHFMHPQPADISAHERFYRTRIVFNSDRNGLVIKAKHLDVPIPMADIRLRNAFDSHATRLLEILPRCDVFTERVRETIAEELKGGDPGQDRIAAKLHISTRTLRRRLREVGTTHKQLVDEMRRELSTSYLSDKNIGTDEVAFLLGFSDVSSFRRAFKRWTGESPINYRKNMNLDVDTLPSSG
jgi:AraC-like DNA-binding protein